MAREVAHLTPDLAVLQEAVRSGWSRDTSADPEFWSRATPSRGQCAITSLVVQDFLGGSLLRCTVDGVSHYWNLLPSGQEVDLTAEQFGSEFARIGTEERDRAYVQSFEDTTLRYRKLRRRVRSRLREAEGR